MTLLLPGTADKAKTSGTEVRVSRRPFVLVVLGTLVTEVATIWITSKADNSVIIPAFLVLGLGVVGLIVAYGLDVVFDKRAKRASSWVVVGERQPSRMYRRWRLLIVVCTIVIALAGTIFVLPLKMWVAEGAANRVAEQLIPAGVNESCSASSSDLNAVGLLMSAHEVCAYSGPDQVWFQGTYGPYEGIGVAKGLIFAPSGLGMIGTIFCARHLVGSWWAYYADPDGQGCPFSYGRVGSSP